ncbi:Adenylate kinase 5, chloroplastic [Porphyridium purpureum]|uniref:Adenylate kinase 5, chloroplastic n=1 Tax=Porphyridium purpureum TaxID=35688 RepID=A0A5J4YQP3_PORPP|nr:Adenylate kinase 5, chloroplastic [Porphyridium purpureum]|eukprot:POR3821..scf236_6
MAAWGVFCGVSGRAGEARRETRVRECRGPWMCAQERSERRSPEARAPAVKVEPGQGRTAEVLRARREDAEMVVAPEKKKPRVLRSRHIDVLPPVIANLASRDNVQGVDDAELREMFAPSVRPARLRIVVTGKPVSGKGTYGPLLSKKYGMVHVSTGNLLRAEVRSGTELGMRVQHILDSGALLDDETMCELLANRLREQDCAQRGFILDGFPRTGAQVDLMKEQGIDVDAVFLFERDDEDVLRWALHRRMDPLTGVIYHPEFNPAPDAVLHRLETRSDDKEHVIRRRLEIFHETFPGIEQRWSDRIIKIDTAAGRPYLQIWRDLSDAVDSLLPSDGEGEEAEIETEEVDGAWFSDWEEDEEEALTSSNALSWRNLDIDHDAQARLGLNGVKAATFDTPLKAGALLSIVRECNRHDLASYVPFFIDDKIVGYLGKQLAAELRSVCDAGRDRRLDIELETCSLDHATVSQGSVRLSKEMLELSPKERSERFDELVDELRFRGLVRDYGRRALFTDDTDSDGHDQKRSETPKQGTVPVPLSFVEDRAPLLVVGPDVAGFLGLSTYGLNVNAYTLRDGNEMHVWISRRSYSHSAYSGMLDQLVSVPRVAPRSMARLESTLRKACVERASIREDIYEKARPCGAVSYRYESRKGLQTRRLLCYDLEIPADFSPSCGYGQVDRFECIPASVLLVRLCERPEEWRPSSALVFIDFCIRHGFIRAGNEPDFSRVVHELHAGAEVL